MHLLALSLALSGLANAQTPPSFEVASIRASQETGRREAIQVGADTVTMRNVSLRGAIRWAYHVFNFQVTGPGWLNADRFDFVAKSGAPAAEDQLRLMLQSLLAERFKLTLHRQSKEVAAYILTVGKNGPKFKESATEGETSIEPDRGRMLLTVQRMGPPQFIDILSNVLNAPVIDQTGLHGKYDIRIDGAKYLSQLGNREGGTAAELVDPLSLILTAIQDELGLKLESRKTPVDLLIVDRVERVPTEN